MGIERLEEENRKLRTEKSQLLFKQDFESFFSKEMSESLCEKVKKLEELNRTSSREAFEKTKDWKDKNVVIEDLEKSKEELATKLRELKKDMERDFIKCEYCVEKFRT